jgi:multicomponent Na+:H+ antiporter subunit B
MPTETWLIFILGFMILGSIVALEIKDILSAIVAIGIVGLALSVAFIFLQAPDLAIVQFLFEIFALILLVRAFLRRDIHLGDPARPSLWMTVFALLGGAALLLLSLKVFKLLPPFGEPLLTTSARYLERGAAETGSANLVSSIVLDYRGYDTLGEVTVLFTAILGALSILRARKRTDKEGGR